VTIVGVLLAAFSPITRYESFLYLISSVFAPMVAILITDFFILKQNAEDRAFNLTNIILWVIGFIIYRLFMNVDTVIGSTVPVMIIIGLISVLVKKGKALICFKKS
jgi:purine-cytosine permease-like protein